jgi:hypothetical protein
MLRNTSGEMYKNVLKKHLLPSMKKHKGTFFLLDGAPCHTSKLVKNYLRLSVMDWPGNSLDLNAIENCWSYMKRKIKGNTDITSLPKLQEAIKRMWELDMGLCFPTSGSSLTPCQGGCCL